MVIDAFMFFDEMDILDLRLHELDAVVDKFVIVDSLQMHGSRNTRPSVLRQQWDRVEQFWPKIKHVTLERLLPPWNSPADSWPRENFQRNAVLAPALEICSSKHDILMVSDADEIPRASQVAEIIEMSKSTMCRVQHEFFYYNVNCFIGHWTGTAAGTLEQFERHGGAQATRFAGFPQIADAGWHFSYFGDIQRIRSKVQNFAHSQDSFCRDFMNRSDEEIAVDLMARKDLFRRQSEPYQYRETNDPRLPKYFLDNIPRFEMFTEEYFKKHCAGVFQ